jgi:hypothetical protein
MLSRVMPHATAAELEAIANAIATSGAEQAGEGFWKRRLRVPIALAFLVAFFNQLSGINAILYFAPRIFQPHRARPAGGAAAIGRHRPSPTSSSPSWACGSSTGWDGARCC